MAAGLSVLDGRLLDAAAQGMSPDEIEAEYYIPAAQAVARIKSLLAGKDIWDEIEQRKLLAHSLMRRKAEIEKNLVDVDNPKAIEAYTKLTLAIDRITDKPLKITEAEMNRISQTQARALIQLVEMAYGRARELLTEEFPFLDLSDVDKAFKEGLVECAAVIES